ncbi:MAG: ATP-binding protein, partial [Chloroflexota bacterium]|nr:ATP-binding protein [Chloroflexota bacterium]
HETLEQLGRAAAASRVYIFENHAGEGDALLTNIRYEWAAPGITSQIENPLLQGVSWQAMGLERWETILGRGEVIAGHVREFSAGERKALASQEAKSVVAVPIFAGQEWWGFIGFAECLTEREWSPAEVGALRAAASTLGAAILHAQTEVTLRDNEEQLRQSQKMEAIGRLAGGVAHDFNNLLTAVTGYSWLLLKGLDDDDPMRKDIEEIKKAARRGSSLTRQLLAFSRRQVLQPTVLDLNSVVSDMEKMLRRIIGEDIDLSTMLDLELGRTKADPGQIEQVIMNLAVNARDAMPQGGKIIIKTENVTLNESHVQVIPEARPGRFVCLSVVDTGIGMDKETTRRIFEPFFSTKENGTGLGLAVVYGIVRQHGGWINVTSEPEQGSTFEVYLPVFSVESAGESAEKASALQLLGELKGNGERILLVEDDASIRKFTGRVLDENGYVVLEAADAEEALGIFEREGGQVHLVFSDVVLPGQSGVQLAEKLLSSHPDLQVLLSSGYTDQKSQWTFIQEKGFRFLQKPYTFPRLLRTIREAMGPVG